MNGIANSYVVYFTMFIKHSFSNHTHIGQYIGDSGRKEFLKYKIFAQITIVNYRIANQSVFREIIKNFASILTKWFTNTYDT